MSRSWFTFLAWIVVVAGGSVLRLADLEERPLHFDEATNARMLADRLEGEDYVFDPEHFHGPWLSLSAIPIARASGEEGWKDLTATTIRLGPVVAGVLTILTPLLWLRIIGSGPALLAGALLATSPLLIYYNRMFIHESWLVLFGMLTAAAVYRLALRPNWLNGLVTGVCVGLMFSTKVTFAISLLSFGAGVVFLLIFLKGFSSQGGQVSTIWEYFRALLLVAVTSIIVGAVFYTEFFSRPEGLTDAFKSFFVYETVPGHQKPVSFYFDLLLRPKELVGSWWTEAFVFLLAVIGFLAGISSRESRGFTGFLGIAVVIHFAIYSLIGYKTTWLLLLPWSLTCLLAGAAVYRMRFERFGFGAFVVALIVLGLSFQVQQSVQATGRLANDARNPYAYVPTNRDVERVSSWIEKLRSIHVNSLDDPIAVVGQEYWPLPWYLRDVGPVGYWPEGSPELEQLPVVIVMPDHFEEVRKMLDESHIEVPRSLRNNVPILLFIRSDLWDAWMKESDS
ncbi:MAG: flippase activity-associated protein Agl23 [Verrucomicrobiota bacterium]